MNGNGPIEEYSASNARTRPLRAFSPTVYGRDYGEVSWLRKSRLSFDVSTSLYTPSPRHVWTQARGRQSADYCEAEESPQASQVAYCVRLVREFLQFFPSVGLKL